ncbi:hypothetical protein A3K42_00350 [candidate division WWE3 bacterium RBG_13_37_7]|uniref:Uncharacterized protein n=1 Tax=candidate division WWE3 bacterium RBG_13_37_7 TaxID=1802609 RepID=A0A1F4U262_UNCKA|nr:MAG: hypothetical protein A3K42_00350 [candidate division WWE3 bacterium RBG_13_37_7]
MAAILSGPPHGIPITDDIHEQYSLEMKAAWDTFHDWWKNHFEGKPIKRSDMPPEVSEALRQITEAPIPGYDGTTGADSCYVRGVNMNLID